MTSHQGWPQQLWNTPGKRRAIAIAIGAVAVITGIALARNAYIESQIDDILAGRSDLDEACSGPRTPGSLLQRADERALSDDASSITLTITNKSGTQESTRRIPRYQVKACLRIERDRFVQREQAKFNAHTNRAIANTIQVIQKGMPKYLDKYYSIGNTLLADILNYALGIIRPIQQIARDIAGNAAAADIIVNAAKALINGSSEASHSREQDLLIGLIGVPLAALEHSVSAYQPRRSKSLPYHAAKFWNRTSSRLLGTPAITALSRANAGDMAPQPAALKVDVQPTPIGGRDLYREVVQRGISPILALGGKRQASFLAKSATRSIGFVLTSVITTWLEEKFDREERGQRTLADVQKAIDSWRTSVAAQHLSNTQRFADHLVDEYLLAATRGEMVLIQAEANDAKIALAQCSVLSPWDDKVVSWARTDNNGNWCRREGSETGYFLRISTAQDQQTAVAEVKRAWERIQRAYNHYDCDDAKIVVSVSPEARIATGVFLHTRPEWWADVVAQERDWLPLSSRGSVTEPVCLFRVQQRCPRGWSCRKR